MLRTDESGRGQDRCIPLIPGIPVKELALVKHPLLPRRSYRTYHPNYLRFSSRWNYIGLIAAHVSGQKVIELIESRLGPSDYRTEAWPWWQWSELRNWNSQTLEEVNNGQLQQKIRETIKHILEKVEGLPM